MGSETKRQEWRYRGFLVAGWAAGIGITLVEMHMGIDYVLSHVAGHLSAIVGWLPLISTLIGQFWSYSGR